MKAKNAKMAPAPIAGEFVTIGNVQLTTAAITQWVKLPKRLPL